MCAKRNYKKIVSCILSVLIVFSIAVPALAGTQGNDFSQSAEIVIAAYNSTAQDQAEADYVCTRANDQTIINKADANGGHVIMLSGSYNIDGTITVPSNTWLDVSQTATITLANASNCWLVANSDTSDANGNTNIKVSGGRWIGNGANQTIHMSANPNITTGGNYWGFGFFFWYVNGLALSNIYIQETPGFGVCHWYCTNCSAEHMGFWQSATQVSNDGLHYYSSNNIFVNDIRGFTNDDMVAFQTDQEMYWNGFVCTLPGSNMSNITVQNVRGEIRGTTSTMEAVGLYAEENFSISNINIDNISGSFNARILTLSDFWYAAGTSEGYFYNVNIKNVSGNGFAHGANGAIQIYCCHVDKLNLTNIQIKDTTAFTGIYNGADVKSMVINDFYMETTSAGVGYQQKSASFTPNTCDLILQGSIKMIGGTMYKLAGGSSYTDITTLAGYGTAGWSGDGGPGMTAELNAPKGVAVDSAGDIYIADSNNNCIRRIDTTGTITTVAGTGAAGYDGDNGAATSAELSSPYGVSVDSSGNIYIADSGNNRIRMITISTGIITTVAGNGAASFSGDGGAATSAEINNPVHVYVDHLNDLFLADTDNHRIRVVSGVTGMQYGISMTTGDIYTLAGNGKEGYSGNGGVATRAELNYPSAVTGDSSGNVFFSDNNHVVRKISTSDIITPVAGNGTSGFDGDGGPATGAELNYPSGLAVDTSGNLYIADTGNNRIREVVGGVINTIAGNGSVGYDGDNSAAASAELSAPLDVAVDISGNIYMADEDNNCIRKIVNNVDINGMVSVSGPVGIDPLTITAPQEGDSVINTNSSYTLGPCIYNGIYWISLVDGSTI